MPGTRKLGRKTDQRMAMLRGMTTFLLENGKIETTLTRAKEVRSLAEKMIKFIELPYEKKVEMGIAGRKKMEREYDRNIVVEAYMNELKNFTTKNFSPFFVNIVKFCYCYVYFINFCIK